MFGLKRKSGGRSIMRGKSKNKAFYEHQKRVAAIEAENAKKTAELQREVDARRDQILMATENREMKHNYPAETFTLADKMDSHRKGSHFKYAVVSNKPTEDQAGALGWLRNFRPNTKHDTLRLSQIKPILLNSSYTELNLVDVIKEMGTMSELPFCMISEVFIHYVPLDTFLSRSAVVEISLTDGRRVDKVPIRRSTITSTAGYNILMCLDFCVETTDLADMTLTFASHNNNFLEGKSWAMCKVIVGLDFFEIARRANIRETMAVLQWADSDLLDFVADPRFVDVVVTNESLRLLRLMHKSGDIENTYEPSNDAKEMITAATIIGMSGDPEEGTVPGRISLMKGAYYQQEQERLREVDESTTVLKPALKRAKKPGDVVEEFRPGQKTPPGSVLSGSTKKAIGSDNSEELKPEDSMSANGSNPEVIVEEEEEEYAPPFVSRFS
jgi:hypothetical protein